MNRPSIAFLALVFAPSVLACGESSVPDPRGAANEFAEAAARGDSDAIYEMMTDEARAARTRADVGRIVKDEKAELAEEAKLVSEKDARVEATARLRFEDGEEAALELKEGQFRVTAAGALPGGAKTPEEALDQLRRVVARRSYAGLMRILSPTTRTAIERDLRALVDGLDHPSTLNVNVTGDAAVVSVPGGHEVRLRRDGGVWRVENFD
ncbi:MAG: hypothetical protein ABI183_09680 [Polyangiaceae bacterium]